MARKIGQCMKCRRRMREVCLNWSLGPACYGDCECSSRDDHIKESEAFEATDFRKKCRECGADAVVCDTAKCIRHCGHETDWASHYALAQRHVGKARTMRFSQHSPSVAPTSGAAAAAVASGVVAPTIITVVPPTTSTPTISTGVPKDGRRLWTPPSLGYTFPYALVKSMVEQGDKHVLLHGVPGTGKTSVAHRIGIEVTGQQPIHVTPTEDTSETNLTSSWAIKAMSFEMQLGAIARSWKEGRCMVLNEINRTNGSVHTALYNGLDDREIAMMTLVDGSIIQPHEKFRFIATMNGDPNELPPALLDRFHIIEDVLMPSAEALSALGPIYGPLCKADYESRNAALIEQRSYRRYRTMADLEAKGVVNDSNRKAALALVFPKNQVQTVDDAIRLGKVART